ncbi:MAG: glycerate kinase [Lentisphaerae bacterium]|nr:glycerate kinase [Lentisphaerota bacterium]
MKIILAFDSFKNCLASPEVCRILQQTLRQTAPDWQVIAMPLGDGGEGTARAVTAAGNGSMQQYTVHDPLFRPCQAEWGLLPDNSAVLEMATASGIELISYEERNPMLTTTYGTGELLKHIICEHQIRQITIGIGGSATVDCGIGMLQALGVKFYDQGDQLLPCPATGKDIARISRIDNSGLLPEIRECRIKIASDVTNELCGPNGAARVFGPQKGADDNMVDFLENNLQNFGMLAVASKLADNITTPGDGAAGGLGFALRNFLHAESTSGAELVLQLLDFDRAIRDADWVITGEGCSDYQTCHGKLCSIVAAHAHKAKVPVMLLSGALGERAGELSETFEAVFALSAKPCSLDEALQSTPANLQRMGRSIGNILQLTRRSL